MKRKFILAAATVGVMFAALGIVYFNSSATNETSAPICGASEVVLRGINELDSIDTEIEEDEIEEPEVHYDLNKTGYISDYIGVNVRTAPGIENQKVGALAYGTKVEYATVDEEWAAIAWEDGYAYICSNYIVKKLEHGNGVVYQVYGDTRKSYEPGTINGRSVFDSSSHQYRVQLMAYVGNYGIYMVNGRYSCAVSQKYKSRNGFKIGQHIDVILKDGTIIPCVIGDAKAPQHTANAGCTGLDGSAVEFIVHQPSLPSISRSWGDLAHGTPWGSKVDKIVVLDTNCLGI